MISSLRLPGTNVAATFSPVSERAGQAHRSAPPSSPSAATSRLFADRAWRAPFGVTSWSPCSCGAPQLDRIGEGAGLLPDRRIWPVFSAYLNAVYGIPACLEDVLQHRPLEQRRIAEDLARRRSRLRRRVRLTGANRKLALFLRSGLVLRRRRLAVMQKGRRKFFERIALGSDVAGEPARDEHEIVVDDVAAGQLEST